MKRNIQLTLAIFIMLFGFSNANAASGGPDPFGYIYKDQAAVGGPKFQWIGIAPAEGGTGTLQGGLSCDDCWVPNIPLGFSFNFYGSTFSNVTVASNGTIYFEDSYLGYTNSCIPSTPFYTMSQYRFIAGLWDDQAPLYGGQVYTQSFPGYFVMEYYNVVPCCSGPDGDTWQIILFANGNILIQFKELSNPSLTDFTCGIQNNPSTGLQYKCDGTGATVSSGSAVLFEHPNSPCGPQSQSFLGANTGFCPSGSVTLNTAPTAIAQTWSNNTFAPTLVTNTPGNYSLYVLNNTGCTTLDTVSVAAYSNPVVNLGPDATICGSVLLDAGNPGSTYAWSSGLPATQTNTVTTSGAYSVTVTAPTTCVGSDAINLVIHPNPTAAVTGPSSICNGSSASMTITLTGTPPYNFVWTDGTTPTTVTNHLTGTYSFTASPTVATNYSVTSLSDVFCTALPANIATTANVNVNPRPTGTVAVTGPTAICTGSSSDLTFTFTGTGPWNFSFSDGTTTTPITTVVSPLTIPITPTATTTYTYIALNDANCTAIAADYNSSSTITVSSQAVIITPPPSTTFCVGQTGTFTVVATGGTLNYAWSLDGNPLSDIGVYSGTGTATLNISDVTNLGGGLYTVTVSNSCGTPVTSTAATLTVNNTNTWSGTTSDSWSTATNWSCGVVPNMYTNVVIPVAAPSMPVVDITGAVCNDLTLNGAGATLGFASGDALSVYGNITNMTGGSFDGTDGTVTLSGSGAQTLTGDFTFDNLELTAGGAKSLSGNAIVNAQLTLTSGHLALGASNLTIADMDIQSTGSVASYVVTDGTGSLIGQNMGTAARTFHVGVSAISYTPVTIENDGVVDTFTVRVMPNVYADGTGTAPGLVSNPVVDRTWMISEQTAGGSFATITPQWNAVNEINGFDNSHVYVAHFMGGEWTSEIDSAIYAPTATGTDPYTTMEDSITSFSPFAVASYGQFPLSIKLSRISAANVGSRNRVDWTSVSEDGLKNYEIERSLDGKVFSAMTVVAGTGDASKYTAWDETPVTGVNYYRVKMTNQNGNATYSNIVSAIAGSKNVFNIEAYPNPVEEVVTVKVNGIMSSGASVQLTDLAGRVIKEVKLTAEKAEISVHGLAAGTYLVTYTDDSRTETIKITKR